MKSGIILKTITFAALAFGMSSCQEFLKEQPESFISPGAYYRNSQDAVSAINAVYAILPNFYNGVAYGESPFFMLEMPTDQANSGVGVSVIDQDRLDAYNFDPAVRHFKLWWQYSYQGINAANTVLKYVPEIKMDLGQQNRILAEARFCRAYFYFDLVRLFGGVPLITKPTAEVSDVKVARDSEEKIYEQIVQDLMEAEKALPVTIQNGDQGRASKGAAQTLLAKVYLTQKNWVAAASKAEEVVNSGVYSLFDDYGDNYKVATKNGKEHIFSIQFDKVINSSNFHSWFLPRYRGIQAGIEEFGAITPTNEFYQSFQDGDQRKAVNFYTQYPAANGSGIVTFEPHIFKYFDTGAAGGSSVNFTRIRFAETLLILAEAENEVNGPTAKAKNAINLVRKRARLGEVSAADKDSFRQAVLKERSWELCYENNRWFDMLRTNTSISGPLVGYNSGTGVFKEFNKYFPIPQREIDNNKSLLQNPGY